MSGMGWRPRNGADHHAPHEQGATMPLRFWRDPPEKQETIVRIVDNRTMVLGLDYLYRESMQEIEAGKLLDCARSVAGQLDVANHTEIAFHVDERATSRSNGDAQR